MGDVVSRDEIGRSMGRGAIGVGTGIGLMVLSGLPALSLIGFQLIPIGIGVAIAAAGLNNLKKQEGSLGGMLAVGAGALTVVSGLPFIGGLGDFFLFSGAVGALVYGGLQIWRSIKGIKSRS